MQDDIILEMRRISKSFPGVKALKDIEFKLRKGTVHAIVGENGAGKSTLMKILSGMYQPDDGEIYLKGSRVMMENQKKAIEMGVSMIYQELNSVLEMTIADNIFLGREYMKSGFIQKKRMIEETRNIMKSLDLDFDPNIRLKYLSIANRQMIEIAKAIYREADIIVMDEPTSSISQKEVTELFEFIRKLKAKGISIIYISHRLEELPYIADEITVIRDGEKISTSSMDKVTKDDIVRMMVGRDITNLFPKEKVEIGDTVMRVKNFTSGKSFKNICFEVRRGEILGISGLIGSGRTEVVRAVFGLDKPDSGNVEIEGKEIKIDMPTDAIKAGMVMISEDRKRYGLVLCRSINENISLPHLNKFLNKIGFIDQNKEVKEINEQVRLLSIKARNLKMLANSLSGGNQQKVVLAKWMIERPKVLIMDEPTRGIDVGAKYEIYKLMCEFAKNGMAIVMISSELPEILGMSDRVLVMADGEIKGEFERSEATSENIMQLAAGGY